MSTAHSDGASLIRGNAKKTLRTWIALLVTVTLVAGLLPNTAHAAVTDEDASAESAAASASATGESAENSWRYSNGELVASDEEQGIQLYSNVEYGGSNRTSADGVYKGIDVSEHNGKIDWEAVWNGGDIDYVIIRCGYGQDTTSNGRKQDDLYWEYNVSECERLGIPYGVYLYSYANSATRAKGEAAHALRLLKGHTPTYPVYFDMEESSLEKDENKLLLYQMANAFCTAITNAGYTAGVYSNLNWWNNYLTNTGFEKWERWVAQYNTSCWYKKAYGMWQCSSTKKITGAKGNFDYNYDFDTARSMKAYKPGLRTNDTGLRFRNSNGTYVKNAWRTVSGKKYYFGSDGYALKGKQTINGKTYYFSKKATTTYAKYQMTTGWRTWSNGKISYFDSKGVMVKGKWKTIKNAKGAKYKYYFSKSGYVYKGHKKIGKKWYDFNSKGKMQVGWHKWKKGGYSYFSKKDGHQLFGKHKIKGKTYNFGKSGKVKKIKK